VDGRTSKNGEMPDPKEKNRGGWEKKGEPQGADESEQTGKELTGFLDLWKQGSKKKNEIQGSALGRWRQVRIKEEVLGKDAGFGSPRGGKHGKKTFRKGNQPIGGNGKLKEKYGELKGGDEAIV